MYLAGVLRDAGQLMKCSSREQLWLIASVYVLLASAMVHLLIWFADGSSWAGPVSWRKPILFGFSFGLTTLSLKWMIGQLERTSAVVWAVYIYVIAGMLEVSLITVQVWRNTASHFNISTSTNVAIYAVMGILVLIMWGCIGVWHWYLYRKQDLDPMIRSTVLFSLAILHGAMVVGAVLSVYGSFVVEAGGSTPNIFGEAGDMRLPHAIGLHAMQVIPFFYYWFRLRRAPLTDGVAQIAGFSWGYACVFAFACIQMLAGRAPEDLSFFGAIFLLVGCANMAMAMLRR